MSDKIHVRANINTLGLTPGTEAEIELTPSVKVSIELGFITVLKPAESASNDATLFDTPQEESVSVEETQEPSEEPVKGTRKRSGS